MIIYLKQKQMYKSNILQSSALITDGFLPKSITENRIQLYNNWDENVLKKCTNYCDDEEEEEDEHYTDAIQEFFIDGIKENHSIDNIHLEINMFIRSKELSLNNVIEALVPAILDLCPTELTSQYKNINDPIKKDIDNKYNEIFNEYGELLKKFVTGMNEDELKEYTIEQVENYFLEDKNGPLRDFFTYLNILLIEKY